MKIGTIGLGKLGLPLATCLASAGHDVVGVDTNEDVVSKINDGISPIAETGLDEFLKKHPIKATTDFDELIDREALFILVPTPSQPDGSFSNEYVKDVLSHIVNRNLTPKAIAIVSTVMPGSCKQFQRMIDDRSGIVYNPEFVAIGSVLQNIKSPDFIVVGSDDKKAGDVIEGIYREMLSYTDYTTFSPERRQMAPIHRTNLVNSELAKLALNSYITMKINFANTIGEIAENIEGGNVDDITKILGGDSRIGRKYLRSGMAYGGTCFPRDNRAVANVARHVGVETDTFEIVDRNNNWQTDRIIQYIGRVLNVPESQNFNGYNIAILGTSYKPDTHVTEESPSLWLGEELKSQGANITYYDETGYHVDASFYDALKDSDLAVLTLPSKGLSDKQLYPQSFVEHMRVPRVLDCWRARKDLKDYKGLEYHALGVYEK